MNRYYLLLLLSITMLTAKATNYYFSASAGNDSYTGNIYYPFRTLNKLNSIRPKPGDKFLLKSNDYFLGSIITNSDGIYGKPVIISTYGGSAPAIVSGVSLVTNWIAAGNDIWYTPITCESDVRNVIMDNRQAEQGRYPNDQPYTGGFLVINSFLNNAGSTTVYSDQLPGYGIDSSWTGATLKIKSYLSTLESGKIQGVKGTALTFENTNMFYQVGYNYSGFFLTNSIKTLDRLGEWYYNPAEKRLYMFFGMDNPNSHRVEVSTTDILFQPRNSHYAVSNIVFRGANKYGISCNWSNRQDLSLTNVQVLKSGITAVAMANLCKLVLNYCTVDGAGTSGINVGNRCDSVSVLNSIITNIGMLPGNIYCDSNYQKRMGYGIYADQCATKGLYVENCKISNIAYIGIFFTGSNNIIYRNYISNTCMLLDDGGAIYYGGWKTYVSQNNIIRRNIILNCQGYLSGFPASRVIPNSIFVDDNGDNVVIDSNFVDGSGQSCLFVHNGYNVTAWNNIFIRASYASVMAQDDNMGGKVMVNIQHNQICNPDIYKYLYIFYASGNATDNPYTKYGVIDNNYLVTPTITWGGIMGHGDDFSIAGVEEYPFLAWQTATKYDLHSRAVDSKGSEIKTWFAVDRDSTIHLSGVWMKADGAMIKDSIKIKDHTGLLLIKVNTIT